MPATCISSARTASRTWSTTPGSSGSPEQQDTTPRQSARGLVDAANRAGGSDNITVVAFEVVDGEPDAAEEPAVAVTADLPAPAEPAATEPVATPVRRRGAGKGGRAVAILGLLVVVAAGALVVWWSINR